MHSDYNYITYHISSYATCTWAKNVCPGWPAYEAGKAGNEEGRVATPASISIFDSYDMKRWGFKFGHDNVNDFKMPRSSFHKTAEIQGSPTLRTCHFEDSEDIMTKFKS